MLGVIRPLLQTPISGDSGERGLIGARGVFFRVFCLSALRFLSFCSAFCLLASRTFLGRCEVRRGESGRESSASLPRLVGKRRTDGAFTACNMCRAQHFDVHNTLTRFSNGTLQKRYASETTRGELPAGGAPLTYTDGVLLLSMLRSPLWKTKKTKRAEDPARADVKGAAVCRRVCFVCTSGRHSTSDPTRRCDAQHQRPRALSPDHTPRHQTRASALERTIGSCMLSCRAKERTGSCVRRVTVLSPYCLATAMSSGMPPRLAERERRSASSTSASCSFM